MDSKTFHVHMTCHLCNREVNYPMTCHRKDTEEDSLWECCECKGHGYFTILIGLINSTAGELNIDGEELNFKCCSQMSREEQERYLKLPSHYASYYTKRFNEVN